MDMNDVNSILRLLCDIETKLTEIEFSQNENRERKRRSFSVLFVGIGNVGWKIVDSLGKKKSSKIIMESIKLRNIDGFKMVLSRKEFDVSFIIAELESEYAWELLLRVIRKLKQRSTAISLIIISPHGIKDLYDEEKVNVINELRNVAGRVFIVKRNFSHSNQLVKNIPIEKMIIGCIETLLWLGNERISELYLDTINLIRFFKEKKLGFLKYMEFRGLDIINHPERIIESIRVDLNNDAKVVLVSLLIYLGEEDELSFDIIRDLIANINEKLDCDWIRYNIIGSKNGYSVVKIATLYELIPNQFLS